MRKLLELILWVLATTTAALPQNTDSLRTILPQQKHITRIDQLNAVSEASIWLKPDSARMLAVLAMQEAKSIEYKKGIANAYYNLACVNWMLANDFPQMEIYCKKAIELLESMQEEELLANTYFWLGCAYWAQS